MINLGRDARAVLAEAAELSRRNGDLPETARVLNQLGLAEITAGEYAAARAALSDALDIATELGLRGVRLVSLVNLGFGSYLDGDADAAAEHHRAALKQTIEDRDHGIVPYALLGIALSETARHPERAAILHGAVDALLASRNEHLETLESGLREQDVARLRDVLGDERFAERHGTGAQKPVAEVFAAALTADDTTPEGE